MIVPSGSKEPRQRLIEENEIPPLPVDWDVKRLRFLLRESKERNGTEPVGDMLSVSEYRGVVPKEYDHEEQRRTVEEIQNYRVVRPGQLAVNTMWLNHLGLGVSKHLGHVSPAYAVYDILDSLERRFAHHLLRSQFYLKIYLRYLYGIRPNSFQIKTDDWNSIPIIVPPRETQKAIADFLDWEIDRIDQLVEKKQRLLATSEDHWERFAFDVFSGQLSNNRSRVSLSHDFLPEIPSHWTIPKLKFLSPQLTVGIVVTPAAYYVEDGVPAVRATNIRPMMMRLDDMVSISDLGHRINSKSQIHAGDVLAVRTGQPGTACVVPEALNDANCIDVIIIRQTKKYLSELLAFFLNSNSAKAQYSQGSSGAIQQHFNVATAGNLLIPTPPIDEQKSILKLLQIEHARISKLRAAASKSLNTLREFRAALITAAVTGQIDVTTWGKEREADRRLDQIQEAMRA